MKERVFLVDDQSIVFHAMRQMLKDEQDLSLHFCQNGNQAIEEASLFKPTVILQDLSMPDCDGFALMKEFKRLDSTKDIPLVVLSSHEDPKIKAEAFALGANDYLVKLPDAVELKARIKYHSNSYLRLIERNLAYTKLAESQERLKQELDEAADYVRSCLPESIQKKNWGADWQFVPSRELGGDAFGYHWVDSDHLAIYLIDVCGHGVGAALLSMSVVHTIRHETLPEISFTDPAQVLKALNNTFQMEEHRDLFFTAWYGVIDFKNRVLKFSSAGHPPGVLFSGKDLKDVRPELLTTPGLVVGASPDTTFINKSIPLDENNRLYLFSDGAFEIQHEGEWLRLEGFINLLEKAVSKPNGGLTGVVETLRNLSGNSSFEDDVSLLSVWF